MADTGLGSSSLVPVPCFVLLQEDFLRSHIKVDGKAGNLGNEIHLGKEKNTINVTSEISLSKRSACLLMVDNHSSLHSPDT